VKVLLDTHTFLWWVTNDARLSKNVIEVIQDPEVEVLLSVVTPWEMVIKVGIGKLQLSDPPEFLVREQRARHHFQILSVKLEHVLKVGTLPDHHKDPFDRLLIAQSLEENAPLVTDDPLIRSYQVKTLW
jgi:PIN domain nuclease of toxin-antitoxin system